MTWNSKHSWQASYKPEPISFFFNLIQLNDPPDLSATDYPQVLFKQVIRNNIANQYVLPTKAFWASSDASIKISILYINRSNSTLNFSLGFRIFFFFF